MKNLSFPDIDVEKMEFSPVEKVLRVFISGAWLDIKGENSKQLGKGILFIDAWDTLSIQQFDALEEKWEILNTSAPEFLRDLCEVKLSDNTISLCGFGKESGVWVEWKINHAKIHAEFDE